MDVQVADAKDLVQHVARLIEEKQGEEIVILPIPRYICDYFLIATARNRKHVRAIAEELRMTSKAEGLSLVGIEGLEESTWVLIDYGDVVVHLFQKEARSYYDLEFLWGGHEDIASQDRAAVEPVA